MRCGASRSDGTWRPCLGLGVWGRLGTGAQLTVGALAAELSRPMRDPWLCVPGSRRVCLFSLGVTPVSAPRERRLSIESRSGRPFAEKHCDIIYCASDRDRWGRSASPWDAHRLPRRTGQSIKQSVRQRQRCPARAAVHVSCLCRRFLWCARSASRRARLRVSVSWLSPQRADARIASCAVGTVRETSCYPSQAARGRERSKGQGEGVRPSAAPRSSPIALAG